MERRERYDPEDIESLLSERSFDELLEEERAYVLRHLTDRNEYETMRGLLLHMRTTDRDQEPLVANESVRTNVIKAFRAQQRPQWQIWLNSIGTLFWPKEMSAMWRPALAFASLAILITAGVLLVKNYGAGNAEVADLKKVDKTTSLIESKRIAAPDGTLQGVERTAEPVTEEAAKIAVKQLQGAAREAQITLDQPQTNKIVDVVSQEPSVAFDTMVAADRDDAQDGRTEDLAEMNKEKAAVEAFNSADKESFKDVEVADAARYENESLEEAELQQPTVGVSSTVAAPASSHVVTAEELAVNESRANVSVVKKDKEGKFRKSGTSPGSRSLGTDATLVSLLNTGW